MMLRSNLIRQVHCLCRSTWNTQNVIRSVNSNIDIVIGGRYTQPVCGLRTGSCNKKVEVINADNGPNLEVYVGQISKIIYKVKVFSLFTSAIGVTIQPLILNDALTGNKSTALLIGACTFLGVFTYVTPILLHLVTKRYILKLEYSPKSDEYLATTYSFFLRNKVEKFRAKDIYVPEIPGLLTVFKVKDRSYFVDKSGFSDLLHYKKIMGFDKPIDFKLGKPDIVRKNTAQ